MKIEDSVLHILLGGLITLFLFTSRVRGIVVLLVLLSLAAGKEVYDHFFILGHCYPVCMDEHVSDFLFSLLFFVLYLPFLSLTQKRSTSLSYKHYVGIWTFIASTHLVFNNYINYESKATLLASNDVCKIE